MSHFVLLFAKKNMEVNSIVDWGEYKGSQQEANLCAEFLSRWNWDAPIYVEHNTERGGSSGGGLISMVSEVKENMQWDGLGESAKPLLNTGTWVKEPKWKVEHKGLVLVTRMEKIGKKFYSRYCGPDWFNCRRNTRTKEKAIEHVVRSWGPGESYSLNESKKRMFGDVVAPRPYWEIHLFERDINGKLTHESIDLWEAAKSFYGTSDMGKMKKMNTWAIHEASL